MILGIDSKSMLQNNVEWWFQRAMDMPLHRFEDMLDATELLSLQLRTLEERALYPTSAL
jgi:hypothetical protein